ncbi:MAG: hypothetical protein GY711_27350 [bacterium]|nr:hypothetical protein [bacterium]
MTLVAAALFFLWRGGGADGSQEALAGDRESTRCRLLSDALMLDDFTLRNGSTANNVVPAGPVLVQLWTASEGVVHETTTEVAVGKEKELTLTPTQ